MTDRIDLNVKSGVARVRLARGDKMNALDMEMFQAIAELGAQLMTAEDLRVVVLSGQGKAFCAGLDMASFAALAAGKDTADVGGSSHGEHAAQLAHRTHGITNLVQHAAWMWRELPMPVIAAVHGVAFGGGFQVALGADLRYAAPDTRFSVMEIKWGLVPDMAGTQLMRHLARDDVVRELGYTGRVFGAEEALAFGFVTRICDDPLASALETASQIAMRNPDAIRADKRLFNASRYLAADEGLLMESREQDAILGSANQIEAVMAELGKRPPRFKP